MAKTKRNTSKSTTTNIINTTTSNDDENKKSQVVVKNIKNKKKNIDDYYCKTTTTTIINKNNYNDEDVYDYDNNNKCKKIKINENDDLKITYEDDNNHSDDMNNKKEIKKMQSKCIIVKNAIENKDNCFFKIIIELENIVKKHLEKYQDKKFIFPEIELRLGRCVYNVYGNKHINEEKIYNKFKNGTEDIFWNNVLYMFNQYKKWLYIKDWEFKIDYIYKPIINSTDNYNKNYQQQQELEEELEDVPIIDNYTTYRYTKNKDFFNWTEKRTFNDIVLESQNFNLYDAKISIANEKSINNQNYIPEKKKLSWVRMKNRKSFILASDEDPNLPMWQYDLTMVWEGADNEEAVINYNNNQPLLEIECECINPYKFLETNNYFNLCNNLINKFKDLLYPFFLKQLKETYNNEEINGNNVDINNTNANIINVEQKEQMVYNIINNKNYFNF